MTPFHGPGGAEKSRFVYLVPVRGGMGHLPAWVDRDAPEDELFVRFGITPENSIDAFDTCSALVMLPATLPRPDD